MRGRREEGPSRPESWILAATTSSSPAATREDARPKQTEGGEESPLCWICSVHRSPAPRCPKLLEGGGSSAPPAPRAGAPRAGGEQACMVMGGPGPLCCLRSLVPSMRSW